MNSASAAARQDSPMVDEMFDGPGEMDLGGPGEDGAGGAGAAGGAGGAGGGAGGAGGHAASLMNELTSSDRTVHSDFQNDFGVDFFDDNDLN